MNERILAGRYRLLEAIGGASDLFLAHDESLMRQVAVKRLPGNVTDSNRQHWEQEIAKAAGLHHPHLLGVYDVVVEAEGIYLITEDLEGDTLSRWLRVQGAVTAETAIDIARQLASAVVQAEKHGILQISIEPGTVLINQDGFLKVIGYGPLLSGRAQTEQDLIKTIGVLLCEMLTGKPFSHLAPVPQVVQELHLSLQGAGGVHSWLPERLERIVLRALGFASQGSYGGIHDLHRDVKAVHHALGQQVDRPAESEAAGGTYIERMKDSVLEAAQEGIEKVAKLRHMEFAKKVAEESAPKRFSLLPYIGVLLVVVLVIGGLWWSLGDETSTASTDERQQGARQFAMPNLLGKTEQEAVQALADNGYPKAKIQWVYSVTDDGETKGKIYRQSVDPGESVQGQEKLIILTVNGTSSPGGNPGESAGNPAGGGTQKPVAEGEIPDLRGLSQQEAEQLMLKHGYHYSFYINKGDTPSGTVYSQSPAAGTKASKGADVTFYVSQ
ncbi:PASTA domain-containing protein [Tumebacillus sp. BK434]|uniref:PASTA domain-containing protein n=1 Tax=Tumebacillus sp. BK434 TaxID=2512169 RepID=UPI001042A11A|nr:PASTA domain-containing protein [Tumebacillus sp. BK434]TCP52818.1 PASTA domain-containing protein [Tumebacillus sp. BK434]